MDSTIKNIMKDKKEGKKDCGCNKQRKIALEKLTKGRIRD